MLTKTKQMGTSKNHSPYIGKKMQSTREKCLQTTGTKLLPSSPEDSSKVSQASYAKIASSNLPNNVTTHLLQEEYPQVSGSAFQFSELVEEISSRIETLPFLQRFPFVTYAVRISEYEKDHEDLSVCGRNSDESFRKAPSLNEQGIEFGLHGQTENLRKYDGGQRESSFENQNLLHSSGKNEESDVAIESILNDQHMEETASEILAANPTNSVHFPNSQNLYFRYNPPLQDISLKSRQLCPEVHHNNDDFATRIFSHIALLNSMPYGLSPFYFNITVEKVVEYAWIEIKDHVFNLTKFQVIDDEKFRQMLFDCTRSWFLKKSFDLFLFLSYCAMICQIGVQAIKFNVENTRYHVTTFLRDRIKEVENALHSCFECNVENNADKIVESLRL